ncbi:adenosylcobinamide-GDP ribazoletransferase [Fulvivirga kasyanovii]|uniref:Adenosylcobinamide-GDP ribazoletransferase n=1 Tax=Fulvivirga kasyanovii TaxID=396812 RepID=A0ABW9RP25_9BACT|nr:adenosylcobinamide-GDP ribazoletransferase [Fulvivirga kasyanovii]MTI25083.1 adenosylcobinamide-GDP ribazoletransferase [Fulvivirga kasyanovii]
MKHEVRLFFTALMFYTRIPCPKWVDHSAEYLNQCTKYFPLIGWLVGSASALVLWLAMFIFPVSVAVILSMVTGILITGAFHEDGFADVCDGFGGGWTKSKILAIMKDSLIGAYGVTGLVLILLMKFSLVSVIAQQVHTGLLFGILIAAHTVSRLAPVFIIYFGEYSREDASSKVKPVAKKLSAINFVVAIVIGLLPMIWLQSPWYWLILFPVLLATWFLYRYFYKWIEGYTGDCLGATQQVTEIIFYLSMFVLWKFI